MSSQESVASTGLRWCDATEEQNVLTDFPTPLFVHHGTTYDHDYYEAGVNAKVHHLLKLIEHAHTRKGQNDLAIGRYNDAMAEFRYTLERFPNHPRALLLLGNLATLINKPRMPITWYERAIRLFPQRAVTRAQYGNYLVYIGDVEKGIKHLEKAVQMQPKVSASRGWLAKAYFKNGQIEQARQMSKQARSLGYKGKFPPGLETP